jgi:peptide/nickel transport system permease protein
MEEVVKLAKNNWFYIQDIIVILLLTGAVLTVIRLSRREYWRSTLRQLFRRPAVSISFLILCMYVLVAVLDSTGYHPALKNRDGTPRLNPQTGKVVYDTEGRSLLDALLNKLKVSTEAGYSSPMATHLFTKRSVTDEGGNTVRDYPPLEHPRKHPLGTDRIGTDVLYLSLKSIRTGIIIGAFTTMLVIPFAIFFGVLAGYFGGWVDDVIQYVYTVLASIPSVLLIVAFMIIFGQGLPQLCVAMGIVSWTGLCRVLRGETMKLREMDYVQAAEAGGLSRTRTMIRHITPNLMHIVVITAVLGFSGRVLAETVLTYIGIGVGADTISWGTMINDALGELARSPVVWWKLASAMVFMVGLVLPANLFGDALRDALDPRLKTE